MATASTPARIRHASQESAATSSRQPSHPASRAASPQLLNATVRFPPDAYRLYSSSDARDALSLIAIERQIAAARTPPSAPTSQSSSFVALRPSQAGSTAELAGRAAPCSRRRSFSPLRTHSSCLSARAEHAGEVLLQMFVRFSDQVAAQLAAVDSADISNAAFRDAASRNSTEPLPSPCTQANLHVAYVKSTRLAISTLSTSPERAGRWRSSRCVPFLYSAPARFQPSRYGAPAGTFSAHRVASAAGCGSAVAPASPFSTRSLPPRVARAVRVACAVVESRKEPTVGASARAAHSSPAVCRIASLSSTVRSTVLTEGTARREYCGGAGCVATGHHIGAVRTRAASVRGCCRAACSSSRSAARYGCSTFLSRSQYAAGAQPVAQVGAQFAMCNQPL